MLSLIFILCLCTNIVFIKSEENGTITMTITNTDDNCTTEFVHYQFTEGQNITLVIQSESFINFGWVRRLTSSGSRELIADIKKPNSRTVLANKSIEGIWEFEFLHHRDNNELKEKLRKSYRSHNYTVSICRLNISIDFTGYSEDDSDNVSQYLMPIINCLNKRKYMPEVAIKEEIENNKDKKNYSDTNNAKNKKKEQECSHCSFEREMDTINYFFGNLLIEELKFLTPCMRSKAYINILKYVESLKENLEGENVD